MHQEFLELDFLEAGAEVRSQHIVTQLGMRSGLPFGHLPNGSASNLVLRIIRNGSPNRIHFTSVITPLLETQIYLPFFSGALPAIRASG